MISLYDLLKIKYPGVSIGLGGQILLQDHGNGPVIGSWNVPGESKPSQEDIDSWQQDPSVQTAYQYRLNDISNQPIYDQLDQIDLKTIRALRTNDTVRVSSLEQEASSLRAQLLPTKAS